ncbi:MAG: polysaccharide biosynthesis/export family protein [Pirellulales bacterium]
MTNSLGIESPQVTVKRTGSTAFVGQHLVGPDGTLNLGVHGNVYVAGMNLAEVKAAVEEHLGAFYEHPEVAVDVFADNHSVYYVVVQGDQVERFVVMKDGESKEVAAGKLVHSVYKFAATGNETVLDALAQVPGLSDLSTKRIWVARPAPDEPDRDRELPVDWKAITSGGGTETNYQLLPGDRLFIECAKATEVGMAETPVLPPTPYELPASRPYPAGTPYAEAQLAEQMLFQCMIVEDTTDALADNAMFRDGLNVCDAKEVEEVIASLRDDDKIRVLSAPKIVTVMGRPAKLRVGYEAPSNSDKQIAGTELSVTAHAEFEGYQRNILVDVHHSVTADGNTLEYQSEFTHHAGESRIMRLKEANDHDEGDRPSDVYAIITPELVTAPQPEELAQPKAIERR